MTDGLVAGRFRITSLLGSGGTAAVFAAHDVASGLDVAVKLLHPHLAGDAAVREAFFEEVRVAQAIAHPGIPAVVASGVEAGDPAVVWIAMERAAGVTLADHVAAHGALPPVEVATIGVALLDALAAAHQAGVVHRDVTPANVMISPDAVGPEALAASVRLLDFGLADIPGRSTSGSDPLLSAADPVGVVASVPYASPEHLSARPVTETSDLYQAGATLLFALTGAPPFAGDNAAVVRAHLSAPPPVPSVRRRGLPREWDRVVTTALMKDPYARYPDAASMRAALASLAAVPGPVGDAASAPASTGVTRVYRTALPSGAASVAPAAASTGATPTGEQRHGDRRWIGWTVAAAGAVAGVIVAVSLSAGAGGAPQVWPTDVVARVVTPSPTPTPSTADPTPAREVSATLPELAGLGLSDARAVLSDRGLLGGNVSRRSSTEPENTVIGSTPGAGAVVPIGSAVDLVVASGANEVPDVRGLGIDEASAAIQAAGFAVASERRGTGPAGIVTESRPSAGTENRLGTTVMLVLPRLDTAPPTPTPAPSPSATPQPTPTPTPSPEPDLDPTPLPTPHPSGAVLP